MHLGTSAANTRLQQELKRNKDSLANEVGIGLQRDSPKVQYSSVQPLTAETLT